MHGELCVRELRDLVGADLSTVSKHLTLLRSAGVLVSEKRGLNVYYRLGCDCFGEFLSCVDQVMPRSAGTCSPSNACC
jgi:ArsR family transcriptional regulator